MTGDFVYLKVATVHHLDAAADISQAQLLKQLHQCTALKYIVFQKSRNAISDILLGLLFIVADQRQGHRLQNLYYIPLC